MLADKLVARALESNDGAALAEIANRMDGKALQSLDAHVTSGDGYEQMTDGELLQRIAELQARLGNAAPGKLAN